MKVLLIGASSFIGKRIYQYLIQNTKFEVQGTYFQNHENKELVYLDITNKQQIEHILIDVKPDVVLWVAGSKNLKYCEQDVENAKKLNTYPLIEYLKISKNLALKEHLIFLSTDYVFDGNKGDFLDTDTPNPNTNYGLSNYLAEEAIKNSHVDYSIVRTSAVMGSNGTFFDWIVKELQQEQDIEIFDNVYFSPTPIKFLAENILAIIYNNKLGVFNICGQKKLTRFQFVETLKELSEKFIANLVAVNVDEKIPYLQHDLSMIPSKLFDGENEKALTDYLKEELENDQVYSKLF